MSVASSRAASYVVIVDKLCNACRSKIDSVFSQRAGIDGVNSIERKG